MGLAPSARMRVLASIVAMLLAMPAGAGERPRARDLGLAPGVYPPGRHNAITDVPGVRVGHATVWFGEGPLVPGRGPARTGVTAILPGPDPWAARYPAAVFALNGNGEVTGLAYLQDMGLLESPILLTNTLNVGRVADAAVTWLVRLHPDIGLTDDVPLPVVAECDDSTLNDIQGRHVREEHVLEALDGASTGPVAEGAVGGGTGMMAFGFKGGIGTSSRVVPGGWTVGVLVQANTGAREDLVIRGVPVGRRWPRESSQAPHREGSIVMVVATDAPLNASQLSRVARRTALGLARTGAVAHHGSGDVALAFSTENAMPRGAEEAPAPSLTVPNTMLDPLYQAVAEATEEAILNAMLQATTVVGRDGFVAPALDPATLLKLLESR